MTNQEKIDALLGITPRDRRIFDAVHVFRRACETEDVVFGSLKQQQTLEQMIRSSILSVYGGSWVTDREREICAMTVTAFLGRLDTEKANAWKALQHEAHAASPDPDCELCEPDQ